MIRARTDGQGAQIELSPCAWSGCGKMFAQNRPEQKCCSGACRAALSRENREAGIEVRVVSNRQLKRGSRLLVSAQVFMDAPPGSRFRLVRETAGR